MSLKQYDFPHTDALNLWENEFYCSQRIFSLLLIYNESEHMGAIIVRKYQERLL